MSGAGLGWGKLIVLGEHAVVYGRPALAAALARGVRATATAAERSELEVPAWNARVTASREAPETRRGALSRALDAILSTYGGARPNVRIVADVELPAGGGLGCSAALGVAIVRAIDAHLGVARSDADVAAASLAWERVFHGNPSGVDSAVAARGGVFVFRRGDPEPEIEPVTPRARMLFVIGDSAEPSATKAMVAAVARHRERVPDKVDKVLDGMAALVQNARIAVMAGDLPQLGKLMDLGQALLNTLLVSTARLEEMCAAARHAGALGAKLTGAGGGGCMIALARDPEDAERIAHAIRSLGREAFIAEAGAS